MNHITVRTGWVGDGKTLATAFRPAISVDHRLQSFTDLTGADPKENGVFAVECTCDDAELARIQANPKYAGKVTVHASVAEKE